MVVRLECHWPLKIFYLILKEEKAARKKERRRGRKKTCPFLRAGSLIIKLPVPPLPSYLKIRTSAAEIMKSNEMFQDRDMRILSRIKNLPVLKTTGEAAISAGG